METTVPVIKVGKENIAMKVIMVGSISDLVFAVAKLFNCLLMSRSLLDLVL